MLVKFLKSRTVQDGTGTTFVEGGVYDLPEASAERWIRRNVAVPTVEESKVNPAEKLMVSKPVEPIVEAPAVVAAKPEPPLTRSRPDAFKRSDIKRN